MLGRWYTRRCDQPDRVPDKNAICFCRGSHSDGVIPCSNVDCPYGKFHKTCLALDNVSIPKKWYCPHCCKLSQYQKGKKASNQKVQSTIHQAAMKYNTICVCNGKASTIDRLVECHNTTCKNGHFFHLWCLGLKRLPNNSKTTWLCPDCSGKKTTTTTSASSLPESPVASNLSDDNDDDDSDIEITKVSTGSINKFSALKRLDSSDYNIIKDPTGWLTGDIIQHAHVLIKQENQSIGGFQRPILGRVRNFDVESGEFIQILHTGSDHWVCVSSIGCTPGIVNLYDSLFHHAICQEIEEQTNDLLGGNLISLNSLPVQQQNNGSDCGVFSVAFATCLAFATNPSHVTFDVPRMRSHLLACFKSGRISMFPFI